MPITTTTVGAAISGLAGGGGGGLGTLVLRLVADSNNLLKGMAAAETSVLTGAANMTTAALKMGAAVTSILTGVGIVAVREFSKWESSFTNMRKTIDGTTAQLNGMARQFRSMALDIPVNVNEINNVAAAAGQLGIQRENIVQFTKTMEQLGETTNLTAETAADQLARFANITQMPQKAFDQLGSTISALDKSSASTAKEIVDMGLRLAGAGTTVGLTRTQILALAAAMSSVGIQAELGGSAMGQVMIRMSKAVNQGGDELKTFAELSRMTIQEFTTSFSKDAAGTILKFVQGTKKAIDEGKDVFGMFDKLNLDGIRVTETLQGLANAGPLLADSFSKAKTAWDENTSLAKTAEERYKTFSAQMQLTMNLLREMAIQVGEALAPSLLVLNSTLQTVLKSHMGLGSYVKDFLIDWMVPAILTGIGAIGDAWETLKIGFKASQFYYSTVAEGIVSIFTLMANSVAKTFDFLVNTVVLGGVNLAISGLNKILPQTAQMSKIGDVAVFDLSGLNNFTEAMFQTTDQYEKELADMTSSTDSFSGRLFKAYEKLGSDVKNVTKKDFDEVKKNLVPDTSAVNNDPMAALRNQAINQINSMQMPGMTKGRGKRKVFTGLGPGLGEFEDPGSRQFAQIGLELEAAQEKLKILEDINSKELGLTEELQNKKLALIEAYNAKVKALHSAEAMLIFNTSSKMFEDLATIAETWGGKQSALYQTMFAASKAFAIAEAIVKIQQGIASAASLPWPSNLAAMASVASATASIVSTISSVTLQFGGKKEKGGPVVPNKAFLVGEKGPELFVPSDRGNIVPNDRIMGGETKVTVNNYSGAHAEVRERNVGGVKEIEVMIRRIKSEIGSEIRDGRGEVTKAMENTFALQRGKA